MHSYGTDFKHSSYIHIFLAAFSIGLYWLLRLQHLPVGFSVSPLLTLTIFGAIEFLFDRMGWRWLSFIPPLHVYDFSGTYKGKIHGGDGKEYPVILTIKQTWSQIEIDFESGEATSKSFSASVTRDRLARGQVEIVYNYFAPGTFASDERVGAHYGTAMLKRRNGGRKLEGEYFTEQRRDSHGRIVVDRN